MNVARLKFRLEKSGAALPEQIRKRNGTVVAFDVTRIERALAKCYEELGTEPDVGIDDLVTRVAYGVAHKYKDTAPDVEQIQDLVETTLLSAGEMDAARAYIVYRDKRAELREARDVPQAVRDAFETDAEFFETPGQRFSFYDKYSRFNWNNNRRETWPETVDRCVDHLRWEVRVHVAEQQGHEIKSLNADGEWKFIPDEELERLVPDLPIDESTFTRIHNALLTMKIMPSMRLLAMAGEAARRNSMALYNCSYMPTQDIQSFVESMLISMAGCGVGFSVERKYVEQYPRVKRQTGRHLGTHVIKDTTEGWGETLREGVTAWMTGNDIDFDASGVRPAGSVLKTKGGRASGPEPLLEMLQALRSIILARQGLHLRTVDVHLMQCWIGEAAVQGGVRRTAMISLFDWDDVEMRTIKNGAPPPFALTSKGDNVLHNANNSAVWPEDVRDIDIMQQMTEMISAYSGEPGIFSRKNARDTAPIRRDINHEFGTNPCGEIILRPFEFCNLSQAVARPGDTEEDLREKVELATIVGKIQSLSTRFPGLRPEWAENGKDERLLGVDLTAQHDCELLWDSNPHKEKLRRNLVEVALETDAMVSAALGVNISAAITCNKPAGNSTEFLNASSNGIHRPHSQYFIRRMLVSVHSPLFRVLRDAGAPMHPPSGQSPDTATKWVVEFVKEAPEGTPIRPDATVIEQCEFWLLNKEHWTEHNPSCTITYKEDEIGDLVKWVIDHKDRIGGLSFFPYSDAIYADQPFEEITKEEFERRRDTFPEIDFSLIYAYEHTDMTTAAQELACFAGTGECAM